MGWRDEYKVHPFADEFPMMPEDELARLQADIEANGLTSPISFFFPERIIGPIPIGYAKANGVLGDGRNRMEVLERMGRELTPCAIEAVHTDPIVFIIGRNVHRRHLTKQEQADYLVKGLRLKEAEAAKGDDFSRHDGEKIAVRGRKPDRLKAKAVAAGKELDIGKRTIERALAEPGSKKPKRKPRRSRVEKERELFIRFLHQIGDGWEIIPEPSDAVLDGLTKDQNASGIETLETGVGRLAARRRIRN